MRLEKATDLIVFTLLRNNGYVDGNFDKLNSKIEVWAKQASNTTIKGALSRASKKKSGQPGYPEYLIYDEDNEMVVVIENKKDQAKHIYSKNISKKVDKYAVNGALWYAEHLKDFFNVIAIGISGNSIQDITIDSYAWRKGVETFSNLNIHEILKIDEYRSILNQTIRDKDNEIAYKSLNNKASELNNFLRDYLGVIEHDRLYVLGAILFALEDPIFKMSYGQSNNDESLALHLYQTVERKVKGSALKHKELIISELKPVLTSLAVDETDVVKQKYPNGVLFELIKEVDKVLFNLYKESELDVISTFFNVFLSYSTAGGSDLGIVLTPSHITNLFCDIADVDVDSKIVDPCAGTGGFLTSAWKRISLDDRITQSAKDKFRKNNIFGIEKEKSIYTIVALNMFLNKDGRSHLYKGDVFSYQRELKSFECNVGFINPPYSDSLYSEIRFVEVMLDNLLPYSIGVAILPVNSVSSRTKKHSDLVETKLRLLRKQTLVASIQMPRQLFYPKGTETIILVFRTGIPNEDKKTWMAIYNDEFKLIKHQKARTPSKKSAAANESLLSAYREKSETEFSFMKQMSAEDQWVYTVHYEPEYELFIDDHQSALNEYISYLFANNYF